MSVAPTLSCSGRQLHVENHIFLCPCFPTQWFTTYSTSYTYFTLQHFSQAVTGAPFSSQGMSWSVLWSRSLGTSPGWRAINIQRVDLSLFLPSETLKWDLAFPVLVFLSETDEWIRKKSSFPSLCPFPLCVFGSMLGSKCFWREIVFFFYMFMAFILIFILISINSLFNKKLQKLSNLDAALGSLVHFQMAPELKARARLHPLACLLSIISLLTVFLLQMGKFTSECTTFYIGDSFWIPNINLILFFSTVLKCCRDNEQSPPFQAWHEVLQNFHADSRGTAIHLPYSQLENLFKTQEIQLVSILHYFQKDFTPDFNFF